VPVTSTHDGERSCVEPNCNQVARARGPECRKCYMRKYQKARRIGNGFTPKRDEVLRYNYGITYWDFERMLRDQSGRCAICCTSEPGGPWNTLNVDHCHETGRVRGLLCYRCNVGLGYFQDDPSRLLAAQDYITHHLDQLFTKGE
jgi:hypothetical protein